MNREVLLKEDYRVVEYGDPGECPDCDGTIATLQEEGKNTILLLTESGSCVKGIQKPYVAVLMVTEALEKMREHGIGGYPETWEKAIELLF